MADSITEEAHVTELSAQEKESLTKIAATIRGLSIDQVESANSGHPGLPLGCAEIGAYLYGYLLRHNPKNPKWVARDRFVLSAGHGSAWLYSCLHLSGFRVDIEDLKQFRQLHSITPGHPECCETEGVESTTGPLGQGVGNAVGQALGLRLLANRFDALLFDSKVFCLVGDGCMSEGVSSEASALAGHLHLNNLVLIYDANSVTLDGPLSQSGSEDTAARYRAYGWDVYEMDGNDLNAVHETLQKAVRDQKRPVLVIARTIIGKGSPNKAGTYKVHGSPLGQEEALATKRALGIPEETFFVPQAVYKYFAARVEEQGGHEREWQSQWGNWLKEHSEKKELWERMRAPIPENLEEILQEVQENKPIAGRQASSLVIQKLAEVLPQIIGGSADLSCSDKTMIKDYPLVKPGDFGGRNIKYGIREFGMATTATGLSQTDVWIPFIGTFLTFSDYMRNAIRLACLSRARVIYQFTHDSVFLGEDGPTHQPVEHLAALRAMPRLHVIRPADLHEAKGAWIAALQYQGPTALIFSRQSLPLLEGTSRPFAEGVGRGAYIARRETGKKPDYTLLATGSELALAIDVAKELEKREKAVRVVSMPCWELFEKQPPSYREEVLGGDLGKRISIEAAADQGWYKYIGREGEAIAVENFGLSAPASEIVDELGFTVDGVLQRVLG